MIPLLMIPVVLVVVFLVLMFIVFLVWAIQEHIRKLNTVYVDKNGYERNGYDRLIHRDVAFNYVYDYPYTHPLRFSEYQVHHVDGNKRNNHPNNLQVLTPEEHMKVHGLK